MIAVVLVLANTYFLTASRDMIFEAKLSYVQSQALILESALRDHERLTIDNVVLVVSKLNMSGRVHVTVMDARGHVLYDTLDSDAVMDSHFFDAHLSEALGGYEVLYAGFRDGAFAAGAIVPVSRGRDVTGAVYVHETDREQGEFLLGLQRSVRQMTVVVTTVSVLLVFYVLWTVIRRITGILRAIEYVREGEYGYKIAVSGSDELAVLGAEFNSLSRRLRETEELRRRFVADASHELKTPLASIRLLSDSIVQSDGMDTDTVREFVADIGAEAERLARTTEKLMTLARLDGGAVIAPSPVELSALVTATVRTLSPLAEVDKITISTELDEDCAVMGSEDPLRGVIFNLVENAIKYNVPGGRVTITLRRGEGRVALTVLDTGIGVPEEDLPHIFDRFYRVDKARSRAAGGSGLGLSIVRDSVQKFGGTLRAEARHEGGMRFEVSFPEANTALGDAG
ncbi:MAG: HAMP domain-containing histidine kinase [Oscillospiraceae bacterium]|jgi:signal transduction histidine kinase|nr:HAMP domain-containing histidine kinase [Oscillospiraceae bacterium]